MPRRDINSRFLVTPENAFLQAALVGRGSIMPGPTVKGDGLLTDLDVNVVSGAEGYASSSFPPYGRLYQQMSGIIAGDFVSFRSATGSEPGAYSTRPEWVWVFGNAPLSNQRWFHGFTSTTADDGLVNTDTPVGQYAGIRSYTTLDGGTYHMVAKNDFGATPPQIDVDTGIAVAPGPFVAHCKADPTTFEVTIFDGNTGEELFTNSEGIAPISADLVSGLYQAVETLDIVAKTHDFYGGTYRNRGNLID